MKFGLFLFFLLCFVNLSVPSKIILAIGGTGLGKSFTATLFGFDVYDFDRETESVKIYRNEKYVYIDTPGFNAFNVLVEDKATIFNILSKMKEENITEVHTILWFVFSDSKATGSLQGQAQFIESLAQNGKDKASNIWDNVIVIHRGFYDQFNKTVIKDTIKKVNNRADLTKTHFMNVFLYHKLKEDSKMRELSKEDLHHEGIYRQEELLDIYTNIMQEKRHAKNPVRILFEDDTCVKCGIKGDRRLSRNFPCHTKVKQRHDKDENDNDLIEEYSIVDTGRYEHIGILVTIQDKGWKITQEVVGLIPGCIRFPDMIGVSVTQEEIWTCCGRNRYPRGCGRAWGKNEGCSRYEEHEYSD